jgi:hypothetical protein
MCGTQRDDDSRFCKNCNFEFLVGKYFKVEDEKSSDIQEISLEKVSQEEFVESNDILKRSRDKISFCVAKYLNNELTNQYNEKYSEIIGFEISEYILSSLNNTFDNDFTDDLLENLENSIHDEKFIKSKNIFIQWIVENRGHLPGMVLNQYKVPIQSNVDNIKNIISLNLVESDENKKFIDLLNEYLNFENEFLENLI